jgi:hypothetical protein
LAWEEAALPETLSPPEEPEALSEPLRSAWEAPSEPALAASLGQVKGRLPAAPVRESPPVGAGGAAGPAAREVREAAGLVREGRCSPRTHRRRGQSRPDPE